jgi:hypothetical protein
LIHASFRPRLAAVALASSLGLHLHQVGQRTFTSKLLSMPSTQRSRWRGGRCACLSVRPYANSDGGCTEDPVRSRIISTDARGRSLDGPLRTSGVLWVPKWHSNPIADRIRRKPQRLPSSPLIENASAGNVHLCLGCRAPRPFRSRLATTRSCGSFSDGRRAGQNPRAGRPPFLAIGRRPRFGSSRLRDTTV